MKAYACALLLVACASPPPARTAVDAPPSAAEATLLSEAGLRLFTGAQSVADLERAEAQYQLAAKAWRRVTSTESKFRLADALHQEVRVERALHQRDPKRFDNPAEAKLASALQAATDARDFADDAHQLEASELVIDVDDLRVDIEDEASKGRSAPTPAFEAAMSARETYLRQAPNGAHAAEYRFDLARADYLRGKLVEAEQQLKPIFDGSCGKDPLAYLAWEILLKMAVARHDESTSWSLALYAHCAMDDAQREAQLALLQQDWPQQHQLHADTAFAAACGGPEEGACVPATESNRVWWHKAADLYSSLVVEAPDDPSAPAWAMRAAYCYKQSRDLPSAISAHRKFVERFGAEPTLALLERGDPRRSILPEPEEYKHRLRLVDLALDQVAVALYSMFDYPAAAAAYEAVARTPRLLEGRRSAAARNAMLLFRATGNREKMLANWQVAIALRPTTEEKAELDWAVATYDYDHFDPKAPDAAKARTAAQRPLEQFYFAHRADPAAAKSSLEAAWRLAKLLQGADPAYREWFKKTVTAWQYLNAQPSNGGVKPSDLPPYADYGAEAEYTLLDEEIRAEFDNETGHHQYSTMNVEQIMGKVDPHTGMFVSRGAYAADLRVAEEYDRKLEHVVSTYHSLEFVPAALARIGSLYDAMRSALFACNGPSFAAHILPAAGPMTTALKSTISSQWESHRKQEMEAADEAMTRRYAKAIQLSWTYDVQNVEVARAVRRLAYFETAASGLGIGPYACTAPYGAPSSTRQCGLAAYLSNTTPPGQRLLYSPLMYVRMQTAQNVMPSLPESAHALPLPAPPE